MPYQYTKGGLSGATQNVTFVDPSTEGAATFTAKSNVLTVGKTKVTMVNATARLNQPVAVGTPECDPCGQPSVSSGCEIRFNIVKGDAVNLASLRTELNRLVDVAIADYNLLAGLLPPPSSTFGE